MANFMCLLSRRKYPNEELIIATFVCNICILDDVMFDAVKNKYCIATSVNGNKDGTSIAPVKSECVSCKSNCVSSRSAIVLPCQAFTCNNNKKIRISTYFIFDTNQEILFSSVAYLRMEK